MFVRVPGALGVFIARAGGGCVSGSVHDGDPQGDQDQQEGGLGGNLHAQWQHRHAGTLQVGLQFFLSHTKLTLEQYILINLS